MRLISVHVRPTRSTGNLTDLAFKSWMKDLELYICRGMLDVFSDLDRRYHSNSEFLTPTGASTDRKAVTGCGTFANKDLYMILCLPATFKAPIETSIDRLDHLWPTSAKAPKALTMRVAVFSGNV